MTTPEIFYVGLIVVGGLLFIYACFLNNSTKWWLCPHCLDWHNNVGEKVGLPPITGQIASDHCKFCQDCARRNINQI